MSVVIDKAIVDSGVFFMKDMDKLMELLKSKLDGKTNMGVNLGLFRSKLS
ncbi:GatB/YqeY domain-containing protein [Candidatus Ruthturnera calyptogenae]|nr:GatB/YqeY domain-containing protein [Candidatus Ruthturnera calyptogenae]